MGPLAKLEAALVDLLDKKSPVKIPPEGRSAIARSLWWVALVVGILQLFATIGLWRLGHISERYNDALNYYLGTDMPGLGMFYYLSITVMIVVAVLLLVASPSLKAMRKEGWNLLFYALLVQAVAAICRLFSDVGGGFGGFFFPALSLVAGAFLLFQARDHFIMSKAASSAHEAAAAPATATTPEEAAEPKEAPKKSEKAAKATEDSGKK